MTNLADIGKKIKDTTQALAKADSELKWELAASAADVAGMVDPTPVSDLVGAGLAVRKGDWLGAGMSLVSTVPYLGDAVVKPAKAVRAAKRINELRQTVAKLTAKLADLRKAEKEASTAEAAAKEAKIARGAAPARSAKRDAEVQETSAKGQKANDCEDCGLESGRKNNGEAPPAQTTAPSSGATASSQSKSAGDAAPRTVRPVNPGTRFYVDPNGKILDANTYARNSGFRTGVRDKTWANAVDDTTGLVKDPLSNKVMDPKKPWDMGHRPGMEYWKERDNAINKWLDDQTFTTRKQFLDKMNDPNRYRPELPESNRSHKAEDSSTDFWD